MIANYELFSKELEKINEWWVTGDIKLPPLSDRDAFENLLRHLPTERIIQIIGPRRAGKTTLMRQLIRHLIKTTEPRNILYYSLDDLSLSTITDSILKDLVEYFLEYSQGSGRKYLFLDEIHTSKEWYKWIKSFFDRYTGKNIKFIISGSSSLTLQKEANQYLRGRTTDITILPFSFAEFMNANGIKIETQTFEETKNIEPAKASKIRLQANKHFMDYLLVGGFPEWFITKDVRVWFENIINDVPKKAIYEDTANLFNIKSPKTLENIFSFIVENESRILSYETINEIAGLHRSILLNYIEYLKNSYLIIEIPKFSKTIKEQIKSKKKYLCLDQGLRNAVFKDYEIKMDNIGFIVENVIGVYLSFQGKTFYFRNNGEIDYVFSGRTLLPVEVKYSNHPTLNKEFVNFMDNHSLREGVIVTKDSFKTETVGTKKIHFIPAWLFLTIKF